MVTYIAGPGRKAGVRYAMAGESMRAEDASPLWEYARSSPPALA